MTRSFISRNLFNCYPIEVIGRIIVLYSVFTMSEGLDTIDTLLRKLLEESNERGSHYKNGCGTSYCSMCRKKNKAIQGMVGSALSQLGKLRVELQKMNDAEKIRKTEELAKDTKKQLPQLAEKIRKTEELAKDTMKQLLQLAAFYGTLDQRMNGLQAQVDANASNSGWPNASNE